TLLVLTSLSTRAFSYRPPAPRGRIVSESLLTFSTAPWAVPTVPAGPWATARVPSSNSAGTATTSNRRNMAHPPPRGTSEQPAPPGRIELAEGGRPARPLAGPWSPWRARVAPGPSAGAGLPEGGRGTMAKTEAEKAVERAEDEIVGTLGCFGLFLALAA